MPGNTGTGCHCPELVDYVPGNEIDVVVMETEVGISDSISSELVQFGFLDPLSTLRERERERD